MTKITYPPAGGGILTKSFEYSYWLGYLTYSTDENGQTTSYHYGTEASQCTSNDLLDRLTEIDDPDGGKTEHCYNDTAPSPTVTTWKLLNPSQWEKSIATMDGMGHVVETQLMTDPVAPDVVLTTYNGEGKVYTVTNPFRGSSPPVNTTTTNYYDVFGRPIETKEQDGSIRQWCYDDFASSTGTTPAIANCSGLLATTLVTTGTWVDSTDENGNHWQHTSDVFGRMTDVMEPNGASQNPSMETQYTYDTLNDLLNVKQCGALCTSPATNGPINRSFSYNSLAQLVTGTNPETGTSNYTYDLDGNLLTKISPAVNAPAGSTTTQTLGYCYDALNRLVGEWSAAPPSGCNSTPTSVISSLLATYTYGPTSNSGTYTGGRLTDEKAYLQSTLVAEDFPTQYDPMGRLVNENQDCPLTSSCGSYYTMTYSYDLAGDVTSSNNGLGAASIPLIFGFSYDGAQRLSAANTTTQPSTWSTSTYPTTLLQATATSPAAYDSWGHLVDAQIGLNPLTQISAAQITRLYDNRGRFASELDGSLYSYCVPGPSNPNCTSSSSGYDNVGNLKSFQDSVIGTWNFTYDSLNRLSTSQNTATRSVAPQYSGLNGCWTYDGFGNRTKEALSTVTSTPCASGANDNVQLTVTTPTASNQLTGLIYDAAGNVLYDNQNHYLYDAEGRLCAYAFPIAGGGTGYYQFIYDAAGRRVDKGTLTSWPSSCNAPTSPNYSNYYQYLVGQGGEQVTEIGAGNTPVFTNVFLGGQLLGNYVLSGSGEGLHFALTDPLGTKRVQLTGAGVAEINCTNLPFGNDIGNPNIPNCPPVGGGGSDDNKMHFTGKIRDTNSGLDYFGARYYSSAMGRFMSPDQPGYQDKDDPQSMNLYSYVRNNPLTSVDPDGHYDCQGGASFCFDVKMAYIQAQQASFDINAMGRSALEKAVDALGKPGDHNGVAITSGSLASDVAADTSHHDAISEGVVGYTVRINSNMSQSSAQLAGDLIHEGTHVAQFQDADKINYRSRLGDLWGEMTGSPTDYRMSYSSEVRSETEAYNAQYYMEREQGKKGQIYDPAHPNANPSRRIDSLAGKSARSACTSESGQWICKE